MGCVWTFFDADIQLSFICQDFGVLPMLMSAPLTMSTSRFEQCQHQYLNEVDIFCENERDLCLLLLKGSSSNLIDYSLMILVHMMPLFVLKETVI